MKNLKEQGITLVALVVTIIILLILAGVTLKISFEDDGLIEMVKSARDAYEGASENEQKSLKTLADEINQLMSSENKPADRTGLEVGDIVKYTYDSAGDYELKGVNSGAGNYTNDNGEWKLTSPQDQWVKQYKNAEWKVLSINSDGSVDIVSTSIAVEGGKVMSGGRSGGGSVQQQSLRNSNEKVATIASGPSSSEMPAGLVAFGGAMGYNNGVYYLNDICAKQYGNSKLNVKVRNINKEDIENAMSQEGLNAIKQYEEDEIKEYNEKNTYEEASGKTYYPNLYQYENGSGINTENVKENGIGQSNDGKGSLSIPLTRSEGNEGYTKANKLTVKQNDYYFENVPSTYFKNSKVHDMLFTTNSAFWLASRFSYSYPGDCAYFGLRYVYLSSLSSNSLFSSYSSCGRSIAFVCPVVSLGSDVQLTEESDGVWTIPQLSVPGEK